MTASLKTSLTVNGKAVELNEYAHNYLTNIVVCAVSMLKGYEEINSLTFTFEGDKATLTINGKPIPLVRYPRVALIGTFKGTVSSLKDTGNIETMEIEIRDSKP